MERWEGTATASLRVLCRSLRLPRHRAWPASVGGAPSAARVLHGGTSPSALSGSWYKAPSRSPSVTPTQPGALGPSHPGPGVPFREAPVASGAAAGQVILCSSEPVRAALGSRKCFTRVGSDARPYRRKGFAPCLPWVMSDCTFLSELN